MKKRSEKKPPAELTRAHLFYKGRVQGVGFRYTAERLALDLHLYGWVKNLPDGRVEILCEGPRKDIELLMTQIRESSLGPHIQKVSCSWETATREFNDFHVEFYL